MPKKIPIEAALNKMRELLEMLTRGDAERQDAVLSALQAILQALVNIDKGAAAVVLATDFKGTVGVYTLNAGEETALAIIQAALVGISGPTLDNIPVEQLGAMQ